MTLVNAEARFADRALSPRQRLTALAIQQRNQALIETGTPTPRRITMALDLAGLFGPEADARLGVEEPTVDQWEAGQVVPTREQLQRLADLAGVTLAWLYRPAPNPLGPMFLCGEGGCEVVDDRPAADVVTMPTAYAADTALPGGGP